MVAIIAKKHDDCLGPKHISSPRRGTPFPLALASGMLHMYHQSGTLASPQLGPFRRIGGCGGMLLPNLGQCIVSA